MGATYLEDNGATRRGDDILSLPDEQGQRYDDEDCSGNEEGGPVTVIARKEGGGNSPGGSEIDGSIEPCRRCPRQTSAGGDGDGEYITDTSKYSGW